MESRTYICDECGRHSVTLAGTYGVTFEDIEQYAMAAGWGGSGDGTDRLTCPLCMMVYIRKLGERPETPPDRPASPQLNMNESAQD